MVSDERLGSPEGVGNSQVVNVENGFVSRGIRVLSQLVSMGSPWISHRYTDEGIDLKVVGCISTHFEFKVGARMHLSKVPGSLAANPEKIHLPWSDICSENTNLLEIPYRLACDR